MGLIEVRTGRQTGEKLATDKAVSKLRELALGDALDALTAQYNEWGRVTGITARCGEWGLPCAEELAAMYGDSDGPSDSEMAWLRHFIARWERAEAAYNDAGRLHAALVTLTEATPDEIDAEVDAAFDALFRCQDCGQGDNTHPQHVCR